MFNEKERDLLNLQDNEVKGTLQEIKTIQELTMLEIDDSTGGFMCDINTGICGPVTQKKEEEK